MTKLGRRALAILILALAACSNQPIATTSPLPLPTPVPSPRPTATPSRPNKLGIHLLLDDGRNVWPVPLWSQHMSHARDLVGEGGYVTELVRLDDLDPVRWQALFDLCTMLHLKPILRLATSFDRGKGWWSAPPSDPDGGYVTTAQRYARFVAALRWPGKPHPVVVGNEPNHGDEWGGRTDPAAYARFLVDTSYALRKADPDVQVLNAPLDPFAPNTNGRPFTNGMTYLDAESFLDQMRAAQPNVFDVVDVWASHSYPLGPLTEGPWQQSFKIDLLNGARNPNHIEPPASVFNRGINGYEWELFKLKSYGARDLQVMITETGWRHRESMDPNATDKGQSLPDASLIAQFVDMAFNGNNNRYPQWPNSGWTPWQDDPRVIAVTPFALDGVPKEWGHTNWLQLDSEGHVLGAYPMFEILRARR